MDRRTLAILTRAAKVYEMRAQLMSWGEIRDALGISEGCARADYYRMRFHLMGDAGLMRFDLSELM